MANKFKFQHVTLFFFSRLCGIKENYPNVNFQENITVKCPNAHGSYITQTCMVFVIAKSGLHHLIPLLLFSTYISGKLCSLLFLESACGPLCVMSFNSLSKSTWHSRPSSNGFSSIRLLIPHSSSFVLYLSLTPLCVL